MDTVMHRQFALSPIMALRSHADLLQHEVVEEREDAAPPELDDRAAPDRRRPRHQQLRELLEPALPDLDAVRVEVACLQLSKPRLNWCTETNRQHRLHLPLEGIRP